jgi:molybdopterin biosynthesis enzyme
VPLPDRAVPVTSAVGRPLVRAVTALTDLPPCRLSAMDGWTGHDTLTVRPAATVEVLVLGDELSSEGLPGPRRTRDALSPLLLTWLAASGAEVAQPTRLPDDLDLLCATAGASGADVLVTTGGTSVGASDHVRRAVERLGGRLLVDGVAVKPGHPMLLARLPAHDGRYRYWVGLPGNPFAAYAAVVTLLQPLLDALGGAEPRSRTARLADDQPARPGDAHRLLPVRADRDRGLVGVPACGSGCCAACQPRAGWPLSGPAAREPASSSPVYRSPGARARRPRRGRDHPDTWCRLGRRRRPPNRHLGRAHPHRPRR